jgi:hypothetical protein
MGTVNGALIGFTSLVHDWGLSCWQLRSVPSATKTIYQNGIQLMGQTCSRKREAGQGSNPRQHHQKGSRLAGAMDAYYKVTRHLLTMKYWDITTLIWSVYYSHILAIVIGMDLTLLRWVEGADGGP